MNFPTLVLSTVLVAAGSTEANRITTGKSLAFKPVIGGFILGILLFLLATLSEDLASKFCYLIIVAALLVNGKAVFGAFTTVSKGK